jgi:hypothetical protein
MKILTATGASQGARDNDYVWTDEGELVWVEEACGWDRDDPDGGCGCGRGFFGLSSHAATTTALVRDLPMSRDDVVKALGGYYESAGYGTFDLDELAKDVDALLAVVESWDVGTVVERRLDVLRARCDGQ